VEPARVRDQVELTAPAVDEARQIIASARIMVVDDDPEVRTFLTELLEEQGHEVEAIDRPEAAIRALDKAVPDLALIDFAMPGMNGAQLAQAMRERHPGLPIAFVTGYAESENLEGALGADVPVLRKPFGIGEITALLARTVRRAE
jgi:CheY-like chemotaxis protein